MVALVSAAGTVDSVLESDEPLAEVESSVAAVTAILFAIVTPEERTVTFKWSSIKSAPWPFAVKALVIGL